MIKIDTHIPPPITISDHIRGLNPGESMWLKADAQSVRTIVSRLRAEYRKGREFKTASERNGIRIWRTA